jgi:hypothetical protein
VTSQGHPYARFRRALESGNVVNAWAAAAELEHVSLADAFALCLLVREREPERFPSLAVRWLGRFCCEQQVTLHEAALVAAHLAALNGHEIEAVMRARALVELLEAHGQREIAGAGRRWLARLNRR